jgi:hypothetical protein
MAVAGLHQRHCSVPRLTGGGWHMLTVSSHRQAASQLADRSDSPPPHQRKCEGTQLGAFSVLIDMAWHNLQLSSCPMHVHRCSKAARCGACRDGAAYHRTTAHPPGNGFSCHINTMGKSGVILTDEAIIVTKSGWCQLTWPFVAASWTAASLSCLLPWFRR